MLIILFNNLGIFCKYVPATGLVVSCHTTTQVDGTHLVQTLVLPLQFAYVGGSFQLCFAVQIDFYHLLVKKMVYFWMLKDLLCSFEMEKCFLAWDPAPSAAENKKSETS
ncbi:hypothetical protein GLYMA_02G100750v4 [Glycine max]|nr:hypothetical protein GLYMA_02G100750v4 [Glycine max]KAH1059639.1 hypothetical protein GYH30_003577 [Glycine max]